MKPSLGVLISIASLNLWVFSEQVFAYGFELSNLPIGKSVTLPRPATTLVPLDSKVRLTATDHRQSIKLTSISNKGQGVPFTLAIYDSLSENVRYVELKPGGSMLYQFHGMNTIQLIPRAPKSKKTIHARLQIESNKPLGIGR